MESKEQKLQNKIFKYLQNTGIFIGSRAWGGDTPKSDWDFIFEESKCKETLFRIESQSKLKVEENEYAENEMSYVRNYTIKFDDGRVVNIFSYKKKYMKNIEEISSVIKSITQCEILGEKLKEKQNRIRLFETLIDISSSHGNFPCEEDYDDFPF